MPAALGHALSTQKRQQGLIALSAIWVMLHSRFLPSFLAADPGKTHSSTGVHEPQRGLYQVLYDLWFSLGFPRSHPPCSWVSSAIPICIAQGALVGGSQGLLQAIRSKPEPGLPDTARLRVNRFLNMTGRSGRLAGNSLGVLGLFFAGFESFGISYWSDGRVPDSVNSIVAGDFYLTLQVCVCKLLLGCPALS